MAKKDETTTEEQKQPEPAHEEVQGSVYAPASPSVTAGESLRLAIANLADVSPDDIPVFELSSGWMEYLAEFLPEFAITSVKAEDLAEGDAYISIFQYGELAYSAVIDGEGNPLVMGDVPYIKSQELQRLTVARKAK
jgi:hypothetical protein